MVCPLCGARRARRACPALGKAICAVCCATKRLTEIRCPSDCRYLASAREHPAAVVVRRQQRDFALLAPFMRDFSRRQSELFLAVLAFLARYELPDLHRAVDGDVVEMAEAMATTYETATRGVIYERTPASLPAQQLALGLRGFLRDALNPSGGGSAFDRDAAVVLRQVHAAAGAIRTSEPENPRAFLDLIGRFLHQPADRPAEIDSDGPRLIVP